MLGAIYRIAVGFAIFSIVEEFLPESRLLGFAVVELGLSLIEMTVPVLLVCLLWLYRRQPTWLVRWQERRRANSSA